jgi:hypothetical protein
MTRWQRGGDGDGIDVVVVPRADDDGLAGPADYGPDSSGGAPRPIPARLVRVLLALTAIAAVTATIAWLWQGRLVVSTTTVPRPTTATVDGDGCPLDATCEVSVGGNEWVLAVLQTEFPDATVVAVSSVFDTATGRTLRSSAQVRTPAGMVVSAMAQCVRLGSPVPDRDTPSAAPSQGPADPLFVVSGAPGCSVAVTAHVPARVAVPTALLERIAHDPTLQLTR